ncbi:hypothetical protein Ac2012v2_002812 [Leucoagaricus gongylophorus]
MVSLRLCVPVALSLALAAAAAPRSHITRVRSRAAHDNTVKVFSKDHYWCAYTLLSFRDITDESVYSSLILPRDPHTNVGDSEYSGGMRSYCSASGRDNDSQGLLPDDFWSESEYRSVRGEKGGKYAQLTGCIRPETIDRLNYGDGGGQYDSSGGADGMGNPRGSVCSGYNHYVELVEPFQKRACIRCCQDFDDCCLDKDTAGCPNVIKGNYFSCT